MGFKVGDKVRVKIDVEGVIEHMNSLAHGQQTYDVDCLGVARAIEYVPEGFITRTEPESWPPQVGDIWIVDDTEFVVRHSRITDTLLIMPINGERFKNYHPSELNAFKALKPVLVRRRDN